MRKKKYIPAIITSLMIIGMGVFTTIFSIFYALFKGESVGWHVRIELTAIQLWLEDIWIGEDEY